MRLLLFDIDQTLIHSGGAGRTAIAAAFSAEFNVTSALDGVLIDGRTDRAIFTEALERIGVEPTEEAIAHIVDVYLEHLPAALRTSDGRVLDGVIALLDVLAGSNAVLGLATGNVQRGAELKLRYFGLWEHFCVGGFGDYSLERSELIAAAIEAGVQAAETNRDAVDVLVIGDTPRDVAAAHAAGVRALGVASGAYDSRQLRDSGADFVLPDLADLQADLAILLS